MDAAPIPLIMTRPAEANARFVGQLPVQLRQRLRIIESPLIGIVPIPLEQEIGARDAVIFTSANGVRFAPEGQGRQAYCVGQHTTAMAEEAGWQSTCAGDTSDALVALLSADAPTADLWHMAGCHTRGRILERLHAAGLKVARLTVYDQPLQSLTPAARQALSGPQPVIVPLFSPRTAAQFVQECPGNAQPHVIALSEAVAAELASLDCAALDIAPQPDAAAMVHHLEMQAARISLG